MSLSSDAVCRGADRGAEDADARPRAPAPRMKIGASLTIMPDLSQPQYTLYTIHPSSFRLMERLFGEPFTKNEHKHRIMYKGVECFRGSRRLWRHLIISFSYRRLCRCMFLLAMCSV